MGEGYRARYDPPAGPTASRHDELVKHLGHTFKNLDERLSRIERAVSFILARIGEAPQPPDDQEAP